MVQPYTEATDYLWDYPSGYYRAQAGLLDSIDLTRVAKTGAVALALWFLLPKDKNKLLKIGAVSAGLYLFY